MTSTTFKIGQELKGRLNSYTISQSLYANVWCAIPRMQTSQVVIKTAPSRSLSNEKNILRLLDGQPHVRRLLDCVEDPPALVLNYMGDTVLHASDRKTLTAADTKYVAKRVLEALEALHSRGYVHTDVKPNNILVNYHDNGGPQRFDDVILSDFGDTCQIDPLEHMKPDVDGYVIGAAIFRSPEAMLNLRWGTPTDIWSFGTTIISLLVGQSMHIFLPDPQLNLDPGDEKYALEVLINQISWFGPVPLTYESLLPREDDFRWDVLGEATIRIENDTKWKPFWAAEDIEPEDKEFLWRIMKLDPRERPTARELLQDKWFETR